MSARASRPRVTAAATVMVAVALLGCHTVQSSRPPPVELPEHYVGQAGDGEVAADRWWAELGSPELDGLVQQVLAQNLELHQAWARLQQAQAAHVIARSAFFPSVRAEAGANTSRQNFNFGDDFQADIPMVPGLPSFDFPENAVVSGYPLTLAASYEIDLWGRVRHSNRAAIEEIALSREQVEAQAITLVGEVADTWFRLLEARERRSLLDAQLEVSRSYLELVEFRFERGLAQSSAIYQQRSQIAAQRRALPSVELQQEQLEHRLALLLGRSPGEVVLPEQTTMPTPPPLPAVGPPADLLHRRPDVRAAFRAVVAADHRVGVAIADRFPKLSLTASTGFQGRNDSLFTNWIYTLSANVVAPLFEGGRRKAEVARTRAVLEERVAAYGQAVLRAVVEVEDALSEVSAADAVTEQLELELLAAKDSLTAAQNDFLAGQVDYLAVLSGIRTLQAVQLEKLSNRAQIVAARVRLLRALGGSWTRDLTMPQELIEGGLSAGPRSPAQPVEPVPGPSAEPAPSSEPAPPIPAPTSEGEKP